jgi:hypothetical protein
MSTNSDYIDLASLYKDLNEKTIILENALVAAMGSGILLTAVKNEAIKEVNEVLNAIANRLDNKANGNPLYIFNAGMKPQLKPVRQVASVIPVPANLVVNTSLQPGTVELKYELGFVPNQIGVASEWSPISEIKWTNGSYFGKNAKKGTVTDLPSMTEVYMRVRTICENGKNSDWTGNVKVKVL